MFKLIFKYSKNYRKNFFLASLTCMIEAAMELGCPYIMNLILANGLILEDSTYKIKYDVVFGLSAIMIGFAILAFIFGFIFAKNCAIFSKGIAYEIRKNEYLKLKEYSFSNLDHVSTSSLLTRITTDINILADSTSNAFRPLFRAPVCLITILILAIIVSPYLSLTFVVIIPIIAIITCIILIIVKKKFIKIQKGFDEVNKNTKESIISIKVIKSYVKEKYKENEFDKINSSLRDDSKSAMSKTALMLPIQETAIFASVIALLFLGGQLSLSNEYASLVASISMFLTYVMQLLATVQMLANVVIQINRAEASVSRINEMLNVKSEIIDKKDSNLKIKEGNIEFKHVYFSYNNDDNYVLEDINLKINKGEFVGILGQTGSSKSTLINLLLRFYDVSKGEILIDGINIKEYSISELRKNFSISFQSPFLFKGTILENITYGLDNFTMDQVIEASKEAESYSFIQELDNKFDYIVSEGGTNLSGGQRQRIALTRALILNPKIIILDDSFSALDRITESKIKENFKKSNNKSTKIIISQKISSIKDSEKIIVLNKGKISNIGNHEFLNAHDEIYKDINMIQNEGL